MTLTCRQCLNPYDHSVGQFCSRLCKDLDEAIRHEEKVRLGR